MRKAVYKLNDSYITYVVYDYDLDNDSEKTNSIRFQASHKPLSWEKGAKVEHIFHGEGVIWDISNNTVTVYFMQSKVLRALGSILSTYQFRESPNEIDSLYLCQ